MIDITEPLFSRMSIKPVGTKKQGAARDVIVVGEMEDSQPRTGEVRIRVAFSGVNPATVGSRRRA